MNLLRIKQAAVEEQSKWLRRKYGDVQLGVWDDVHVRFPFYSENLYYMHKQDKLVGVEGKWMLVNEKLSRRITSSAELTKIIQGFNTKYEWDLSLLSAVIDDLDVWILPYKDA